MLFKKKLLKEISFKALGTNCSIILNEEKDEYFLKTIKESVLEFERRFSVFKDESEISQINNNRGNFTTVSEETIELIELSIKYSSLTMGYFDITIKPLVELWNIGKESFKIPKGEEINLALKKVNFKAIKVDKELSKVKIDINQKVEVGAVAKGYLGDKIKNQLLNFGINDAIINLGGNVVILGRKTLEKFWCVGIQDPLGNRGEFFGLVNIENKSIVTSGPYERFSINKEEIYNHILNPKTGYPFLGEILSITIISENSIDGDGLSTGLYILGVEESLTILKKLGLDGVIITTRNEVIVTENLKKDFILLNNRYKVR